MAVNLKAVATLNGKPFLATLRSLSAATEKQTKSAIKGSNQVKDSALAEAAARETASQAATTGSKSQTAATGKNTQANRNLTASQKDVNRELVRTGAAQGIAIDRMSKMTAAQQRQLTSARNYSRELQRHSQLVGGGLAGPAAEASAQRVQRFADSLASANRAVASSEAAHQSRIGRALDSNMQKVANDFRSREALSARAAAAETAHLSRIGNALDANMQKAATDSRNRASIASAATASQAAQTKAMTSGTTAARNYASGLSGLTQDKLKLQAATERLGAAEGRLASAMAKSNGVVTPAVHAARAGVNSATAAYNALTSAQVNAASGLAAQRYLWHDVSRQMLGVGIAMGAIPAAAVVVGAVWENQFANVIRTSDPELAQSASRVDALRTSMTNMAKTMPMSFGNLTEIATLGNQMGVAANELDSFTKAVGMFSATSGIDVDEAATAFGRLRTVASDANFSYMGVADSILKVGVNSVATEQEIINVTTQISSIAAQAGFSTKEMIGLSGALASVRVPPELSRSIVTRAFTQFDRAIQKNGTELQTLARVSGRTVEDIKKNWGGPGAADIFLDFTQGLQRAGRQARLELEAIGITSVRDVPALLRLANAADSNGLKGGLFAQTLEDAHTASGTVQQQYAVMAETVVGRLKVLGNSVLSFFDTLGSGSNSFVKGAIDGLTGFFQMMEKIVDNPFSSWALGAMAAVAGIALATSGLANLTAGIKMFQHVSAVTGGASFMSAIGMSKKAGGTGELAAMSPLLLGASSAVNSFTRGAKAAGSAWGHTGRVIASNATGAFASFAHYIGRADVGNRAMNRSLATMAGQAPKTTGVLANLVKFGLGPVGIGLATIATIGTIAYTQWANGFYEASTTTEQLAENLSTIDMGNTGEVSKILKTINIDGRELHRWGTKGINPFEGGVPELINNLGLLADYRAEMEAVDEMHSRYKGNIRSGIEKRYLNKGIDGRATETGLKTIDGAFQEMRAAGNDSGLIEFWSSVSEGADTSAEGAKRMSTLLKSMDGETAALTNQFAIQGMTLEEGLVSFRSYSREARDLAAGFDGTSIIADTFGLSEQEAADFGNKMNDAAAAFINLSSAVEAGTVTDDDGVFQGFDLSAFRKELKDSMKTQDAWMDNMRSLVTETTPDAIQAMGELGPAGKELAQSLVDGLASADPKVRKVAKQTLKTFEDYVHRSKIDFGPHLAEYTNVITKAGAMLDKEAGEALTAKVAASFTPDDWSSLSTSIDAVINSHGTELGGRLGKRLFEGLNAGEINVDQFDTLSNAFKGIGYRASQTLMDELDRGISWESINARIERIQTPQIPIEFEEGSVIESKIKQSFRDMFGARGVEVPANFSLETTLGDLRDILDQQDILPELEADLTINKLLAEDEFEVFRTWLLAQGIDIEITANPNALYLTLDSFKWVAEGTVTTVELDALTELADDKLYQFILTAEGDTVAVEVDANTLKATNKVHELGGKAKDPQWMLIDADTDKAIKAIEEANAIAEAATTSEHLIKSNADEVAKDIDSLEGRNTNSVHTVTVNEESGSKVRQAEGSVLQFYANGGVRENHVAQIAPAGAMRLWAEPETGGEAYIPLAKSKRIRSEAILNDVAQRFGYALQPQNYTKFADGGQYMAQAMSRQRYSVNAAGRNAGGPTVQVGPVSFTDGSQKDQFREFTRTLNRFSRRLK